MILLFLFSYFFGSPSTMGHPFWWLFVAVVGLIWYFRKQSKPKVPKGLKEIPGPTGLPIIGNLLQMGKVPNKQFCKWSKEYGPIYQVKIGHFRNVIISDPKMAKEIFSTDPALTGRVHNDAFAMYQEDPGLGMFNSEGERWAVHRRFLLRQLRDFGFGKTSMSTLIMEECEEVLGKYKKQAGKPVTQIRETLRLALVNSLWRILSNQRFSHDDPQLLKLANNTSKAFNDVIEASGLLLFLPWIKYIIPDASGYTLVRQILKENRDLFEKTVQDHKKNFDDENLKDFIDVYLAEARKSDPTSTFYGDVGERQLVNTLFDLFFAGSDTTAITLSWSILYLCKFPEVQKKLQDEIHQITGNSRRVAITDRPSMPYAVALLDEILRYSSIVPDGVGHRAMKDVQFRGYHIPKDSLVQPNLMYIHQNPELWGDPENFRPERFLSADGKKYVKSENLQPFQVGKRQCAGEAMARDTIFLYLTNLFQSFNIKFDPNKPEPTFESEIGFLLAPLPFSVIMTEKA